MAATQNTVADPQGFFTPAEISPELTEYMRVHRVDYSGPGEHEGIRQHECFEGRVNTVQVHPSFPAAPVMTHDGVFGHGFHTMTGRTTWATSDRRAAVKLAKVQRARPDSNSNACKREHMHRVCAAAESVIELLADFMGDDGNLDRDHEDYAARAIAALGMTGWDHATPGMSGGMFWIAVDSCMSALAYSPARQYRVNEWAKSLANLVSWHLRRAGDQGLIANRAVTALCDRLAEVSGQG